MKILYICVMWQEIHFSCRISIFGSRLFRLIRLPPQRHHSTPPKKEWRSQGGAGTSYPCMSVWIPSWYNLGFGDEHHRLLLGGGWLRGWGKVRRMLRWAKRRTSSRGRCCRNHWKVWEYRFKSLQGNRIYLGTNLQAEEFTPLLHNKGPDIEDQVKVCWHPL